MSIQMSFVNQIDRTVYNAVNEVELKSESDRLQGKDRIINSKTKRNGMQ